MVFFLGVLMINSLYFRPNFDAKNFTLPKKKKVIHVLVKARSVWNHL